MKTSNWMKRFAAIAGSALMGLMLAAGANAANPEPVPVEVEWIIPAAIFTDNPLQFGQLDVGTVAGQTVTINTDDTYAETTANTVVGGAQAAAQVTITATDLTGISILVDNAIAGTYYTLGTFKCSYAGAADAVCDSAYPVTTSASSSTSGDIVEIGAILTVVGVPTAITDDTTFDVTVIYQ